jgi:hypothetical protein
MRGCRPQANNRTSDLKGVPALQAPRGLELIQSSAKLYANGVAPTSLEIQATRQVEAAPSKRTTLGGSRVHAAAIMFLLFLLLPSLGLAAIVSYGTWLARADVNNHEIFLSAPTADQAAETSDVGLGAEAKSISTDVIIRKVKTEHIDSIGLSASNPR